jgi:hypothetical protein
MSPALRLLADAPEALLPGVPASPQVLQQQQRRKERAEDLLERARKIDSHYQRVIAAWDADRLRLRVIIARRDQRIAELEAELQRLRDAQAALTGSA